MNQVEQWFSILQRKRLRAPDFADLADLENKILAFIDEWNEIAHPFAWTTKSFEKVLHSLDDPWRRRPHWSDAIRGSPAQGGRVMSTNLREAVLRAGSCGVAAASVALAGAIASESAMRRSDAVVFHEWSVSSPLSGQRRFANGVPFASRAARTV